MLLDLRSLAEAPPGPPPAPRRSFYHPIQGSTWTQHIGRLGRDEFGPVAALLLALLALTHG